MKEKPILFMGEMVKALLAGTKTQTRRILTRGNSLVNGSPCPESFWEQLDFDSPNVFVDKGPSPAGNPGPYLKVPTKDGDTVQRVYPRMEVGDLLYCKETFLTRAAGRCFVYRQPMDPREAAGIGALYGGWKPAIFMPRRASRITLEVLGVEVQRLQDISEEDAKAEGCEMEDGFPKLQPHPKCGMVGWDDAREWYSDFWEQINGEGSWDKNPWVWKITFKRIKP